MSLPVRVDAINSCHLQRRLSVRVGELVESVGPRHAAFEDNLIDLATQLQIVATNARRHARHCRQYDCGRLFRTAAASSAGIKVLRFSSILRRTSISFRFRRMPL